MSPKTKKIINIVVDVVVALVLAFALFLAICTISSKKKGNDQYTEVFGTAYLAVASPSMTPTFSKGDMIKIKIVSASEAKNLKVGDIITFRTTEITKDGRYRLNSHRITQVFEVNGKIEYETKGDNNAQVDSKPVPSDKVIGVYQGKASGIGHVFLFMSTSTGFFVCVVLPTLLIVVYCAVNLILVIRKEKKKQTVEAVQAQVDERERMRQELLAEMQANQAPQAPPEEIKETEQDSEKAEEAQPPVEEASEEQAQPPVEEASEEQAQPPVEETNAENEEK